ncbi:hypothetical protein GIB67_031751 [Kingdonia uniflora]|uniref:Uncharacterized protein n=1 Tax=Kingdonia uniflora TaxID=39325 RepID=A0A7J7NKK6_9MAGN|nr:hypothetical protein GIB67_031751 [Kingdonia uniflora]
MVKTRSQRAVEARALNDLRLAFKIDEIREVVFGQQGYDARFGERCISTPSPPSPNTKNQKKKRRVREKEISTDDSITTEGGKDKKKAVTMSLNCKLREEAEIEEALKKLQKLRKPVRTNAVDSHSGVEGKSIFRVGDEEDTVAELVEWPRLKGSQVKYPTGSSRFREFCKAKSSIDRIWGHAFGYRGNFFRTCSVSQGGEYLYLLPDLAKEKKCRNLGDEVSLEYVQGMVKDSQTDGFCCYLAQFDNGLTLPLRNLAKSIMNMIGACLVQLNSTDDAYLSSSSSGPCFFDLSSAGRVWNDNLLWVSGECLQRSDEEPLELNNRTITKGISCKVLRKESFIDVVAKEGTELEAILKEFEISRFKRVASKDDKVKRSQAKRRMAGKTPGPMEEKLLTPELNTPLKLTRLIEMPDRLVDIATISSTVVRNLAKRKAIKRGAASRSLTLDSVDDSSKRRKVTSPTKSQVVLEESDKIVEGADLRLHLEVEASLLEEQCRAKAREKMVAVVDDEFKKLDLEKEWEAAALKLKEVRAKSVAETERLVTADGNYLEKEIVDEEEVEEMEDGLNVTEKTTADNQETIDQEIASSRLRVVDLEGLLEVEKKSFAELQELDVAREREEHTLLYNAEYADEYEALISQYEDRLDDNVKHSLKLEEAKRQVEDKTATILSRDLALNQLTSELAELKEKATSGSQHKAELAECRIRVLNDEISNMKCNIRALNEHLLKREIDLDTARTNLVVSVADFEKLSNSIVGKDLELRNSTQIRDSLIIRLDRLKVDLCHLKGGEG